MKKTLLPIVLLFITVSVSLAQTVTRTYVAPSSVSIDGVGNYGTALPAVNFTQGDFTSGCLISDVDVTINWAKTDGSCSSPGSGNSSHMETSFRIDGPSSNQILAIPGTWSGGATTTSVTTTFNQGSGLPSGTPVTGTFGPNTGNLNNYNGTTPFGNWNLAAGDNALGDPLCLVWYSVTITTAADNIAPTYTSAPSNITLNAGSGVCTAVATWSQPTVTDACGATVSLTGGLSSGSAFPVGTSTVTYQAIDTYGNTNNHSFTVTVIDNQAPTINCPANITAIAPNGTCAANVTFTTPTPADNCPGATVAQIGGPTSGTSFPLGNTTVTFRATDASGNTADCSFTVTVVDIEDPVISCPGDIAVVSTTGNCGAVINYTAPVGTDNCPGVSNALTAGFASGSTFPSGTTTVTYEATDASGNTASCSFTVTVDPVPNGTIALAPSPICLGDPVTLTFTFTSGTPPFNVTVTDGINSFNVNGISSGGTFVIIPPTTVTYSYIAIQDATGCARTSGFDGTADVVVTPLPNVNFTGLDPVYCETDPASNLSGSQNGGTFFGVGVTNLGNGAGTFDPAVAGPIGPYDVTYIFTDINSCTDSEVQQVSVDEQPVADAGAGADECDLDFTYSAVPSVGTGTWTTVSGPGLAFFSGLNSATSLVQVSAYGTYVFQWEEVNGVCSDADQITVNFYEVPSPDPGFPGTECDFDFQLGANPSIGTGTWSASGPGTATFTPNVNDPDAVVTVDAYGIYLLTWTEDNNGCTASASINITFEEQSVADAGAGGDECDLDFTFSAVPSVGTGVWTGSGPGSSTFNAPNSPTSNVTVSNYGTYTFTWTETNGNCVSIDQVTVNFYEQPVTVAGPGGDECDLDFTFSAVPSVGNGLWTSSGPGTATFVDDTEATTDVTVDVYGTYVFTWTETNGICTDSRNVLVNFYEQPVANAGIGGDACDLDFTFSATPSIGTGTWTSTGPGTATFADASDATTDVGVSTYGTYVFTWTEVNGTCSDDASVTVNFYEQPVADAGNGGDECDLDFLATATPSSGTGMWSQTSGPGTASFNTVSSPVSLITVDVYGTYDLRWTETNGSCTDGATITVNFYEQPVADPGSGGDECDLDFVFSAVPSVGNGLWTQASGPGTSTFTDDTDPTTSVTVSASGAYVFTWTETNGTCVDAASITVNLFDQAVADAGSGGDECDLSFVFNGTPSFGVGTWTYTGPGNALFSDPNSAIATTTVDVYGTYQFTWTEVSGICTDDATITVNFYEQPVADADTGGSECDLDFDLDATPSVGNGTWTFTGPGTATFSPNANDPDATATVDTPGSYDFAWTEDNNGCVDSDVITVVFNSLPVVSFTGLAATYCVDQTTPVPLTGTPAGGDFSGLGISGNSFVPSVAGIGTIFITYTYTDINGCTDSETQTVDVNGLPNVSFTGLLAAYCEDDATPFTLIGNPTGGTFSGAGISGDDLIPSDAGAGIHTITYSYTDPFGCTSSEDQDVTINELPVVSFTGLDPSYCVDAADAPLVGDPAGGTFSGTGISGSMFSPSGAGVGPHTVTYTYTDGNGCTNSIDLQVMVNPLPVPVIAPSGVSEICVGDNLILDAGNGYSIYDWSNSENGQTTSVNSANSYNVTVTTAEGCTATSASVQVVVNQLPVVDLGNDTTICTASVLTLDAGNPGATYSWSTFETTETIGITTSGVFIAEVTDLNNCVGTDDISVTVSNLLDPVIVANGPLSFCDGGSVTLDAGIYETYQWSNSDVSQTSVITTSGVVEVQVWDEFGCSGTDEAIVAVLQLPNAVITPTGPIEICDGDSVELSSSNTFSSYSWSPGNQTTNSISVTMSGSYEVTVVDPNNGCGSTSDPVLVTVNTTVPPTIVASGAIEFCNGESVSLSVEPGPYNSYLWCSGSTTPSIVVTEQGCYCVTVLDANGCEDSTLLGDPLCVTVWEPQPIAQQQGDSIIITNGPYQQYQWYFNGVEISGATDEIHVPAQSGNYVVEVWDDNGCSGTSSNVEFTFTGIADLNALYDIDLYPNPTGGKFTLNVDFGKRLDATLSITDVIGRQIMLPESTSDVSSLGRTFDLSHLALGVYHLKLATGDGSIVKQIIRN